MDGDIPMAPEKILMIDTETANTLDDALVYNIGYEVIDRKGRVYENGSFLVREVWCDMPELMLTAYYADKIPQYEEMLLRNEIVLDSYANIKRTIKETCDRWNCKIWCAHNARFDNASMNTTQRYLTKSKYRYFLPYGMTAWDTMKMAQDVILPKPTYRQFCEENGFMTAHRTPRPRLTAEVLYRYIVQDAEFVEEHKALEDVDIERQILAYCFRQHKAMRKELWND